MFEGGVAFLVFGEWIWIWCINGVVGRIEASRHRDGKNSVDYQGFRAQSAGNRGAGM